MGKVIASGNPGFQKGDFVAGLLTWGEYTVVGEGGMLNKLDTMGFPLSYHVGVLGEQFHLQVFGGENFSSIPFIVSFQFYDFLVYDGLSLVIGTHNFILNYEIAISVRLIRSDKT